MSILDQIKKHAAKRDSAAIIATEEAIIVRDLLVAAKGKVSVAELADASKLKVGTIYNLHMKVDKDRR